MERADMPTYGRPSGLTSDRELQIRENFRSGAVPWLELGRQLRVSPRTIFRWRAAILEANPHLQPAAPPQQPTPAHILRAREYSALPIARRAEHAVVTQPARPVHPPQPQPESEPQMPQMPDIGKAAERRRIVWELHLRRMGHRAIARAVNTSESTVRRDLEVINKELLLSNLGSYEARLNETIEELKAIQYAAWQVHEQVVSTSMNKVSSLNTAMAAQIEIAKFTGLTAPDTVNSAAFAQAASILLEEHYALAKDFGIDVDVLKARYYARVQAHLDGTSVGVMLGAIGTPAEDEVDDDEVDEDDPDESEGDDEP
jgi:hypothetical protein